LKRRLIDIWENIYNIFSLRGEYFRIQYRYRFRPIQKRKIFRRFFYGLFFLLLIIVLIITLLAGYSQSWTGFSSYYDPKGTFYPSKKLWDWMGLLLIPALLALLAYFFSRAQSHREIAVELLNKREQALQDYLDYMTHLLVDTDYHDEDTIELSRRLARARTITVLEMLKGNQKGYLVRFLSEAELINRENPFIDLDRANLQGLELIPGLYNKCKFHGVNLDGARLGWCSFPDSDFGGSTIQRAELESINFSSSNLDYANLSHSDLYNSHFIEAHLTKARLEDANFEKSDLRRAILDRVKARGANFRRANLTGAYLQSADLRFTNLREADLTNVDLKYANLYGAKLQKANLSGADLTKAYISKRQLTSAKSIENTILPASE